MSEPGLWSRLKKARMVQVLLVYLGACWIVLQVVDVLQNTLALPDWIGPVSVILLAIGLVIILATAWIQSNPGTAERARSGELPRSWELDPRGLLDAVRNREMPHLTWGRSLLGGVFAFWFLFGLAGLYVVIKDAGESFSPPEAVADDVPTGIAVVPFSVTGGDLGVWREGMVDLLTTNLDGVGGFRTIDSRTVLARWNEVVPEGRDPDLEDALEVARRAGARYVLLGTAVSLGGNVRLVSDIYDVTTGEEVGQGQVEGPLDDVMSLVDRLSVATMRALLESGEQGDLPPMRRTSHLTTGSVDALRAYLEGETYYRRSEWPQAVEAYERAVEEDSTFALALFRLSDAYGWLENIGSEKALAYLEQAVRHVDRLPAREATLVLSTRGLLRGDLTVVPELQDAARKYPDDPEAAFQLAEWYFHFGEQLLVDQSEAEDMLARAVTLDPTFGPYYIHLIEAMIARRDTARADELLATYQRVSPESEAHDYLRYARNMYVGSPEERAAALAGLDTLRYSLLDQIMNEFNWRSDDLEVQDRVLEAHRQRPGSSVGVGGRIATWGSQGRFQEALTAVDDSLTSAGGRVFSLYDLRLVGAPVEEARMEEAMRVGACEDDRGHLNAACSVRVGFWAAERGNWAIHADLVRRHLADEEALAAGEGQERHAEIHEVSAGVLRGYAHLVRGDFPAAIRALEAVQGRGAGPTEWVRWWLAVAHRANGSPLSAIRYYEALRQRGSRAEATLRLGTLYEEVGRLEEARQAYRGFLTMWKDADPGLPRLERAREGLARIGDD